jgi:hypothetical protein
MKIILMLVSFWLSTCIDRVETQVVKDPLLDYYQCIKSGGTPGDDEPHYLPQTQIYYFKADFTGDGKKSIFVTDEEARQGPHGLYGWFVYYPLASGGYVRLEADGGIGMYSGGPDYIGYVDEIKRYGIVLGGKDGVGVYYFDHGTIQIRPLDLTRGHADAAYYPKYFRDHLPDYHMTTTTLAELAQRYAKLDPTNVIPPAAK